MHTFLCRDALAPALHSLFKATSLIHKILILAIPGLIQTEVVNFGIYYKMIKFTNLCKYYFVEFWIIGMT